MRTGLDSRLRGNDESIHTETCTTSFPRKWESRTRGLSNCFYPISFCADRSGFPPAREWRVSRLWCCRNATEPSFPRKWESRISGFQSFPIDSRRVGGLDSRLRGNDEFQDYGVVGNDGSGISLRLSCACKRRVHQKCRLKVQTASVSGNQRAVGWASARHFHQFNISTVFIESIESAPFDDSVLRNWTVIPTKVGI